MLYKMCQVSCYIRRIVSCHITCVMLLNNMSCHVIYVMLYNMCHVMLYMLRYITCVMLYICYVI